MFNIFKQLVKLSHSLSLFWYFSLTGSEVEVQRARHKSILQLKRIEVRLCSESESDIFMLSAIVITLSSSLFFYYPGQG